LMTVGNRLKVILHQSAEWWTFSQSSASTLTRRSNFLCVTKLVLPTQCWFYWRYLR